MLSRIAAILLIAFFGISAYGQDPLAMAKDKADAIILQQINAVEAELVVSKEKEAVEEISSLESTITMANNTLSVTENIYQHYLDVLEFVETVSTSISTYKRVEDFWGYIAEMMELYSEYGVNFTFYSLYDFDKYINPDKLMYYIDLIYQIFEQAEVLSSHMATIVFTGKSGVKADDYERMKEIKKLNQEARVLLYKMQNVVFTLVYLVPAKSDANQKNITLQNSFYNYETYAK